MVELLFRSYLSHRQHNPTTLNPIKLYSQLINLLRITTMIYLSYFTIYFVGTIVVLLHLQLLNIGWVLLEEGRLLWGLDSCEFLYLVFWIF